MSADICVIGSNSFSGSSFAKYALEKKQSVLGLSRSPEPIYALAPHRWIENGNFSFSQMDLNLNLEEITDLISEQRIPYIVNFAAQSMVAQSWENPNHWFETNVVATVKLHDNLRKMGHLKKYVHISTPEVYGNCEGFVDEETSFNPSTPYAVSRAAADMSLRSFYSAYNFPYILTRAANVYGPGQQLYRIIPRTILFFLMGKKLDLHGGGHSQRSFIHIDDVSTATFALLEHAQAGEEFHISTNRLISIRELVEMICAKLDVCFGDSVNIVNDRLGKDASYTLSSKKIRNQYNWSDKTSLEDGIDQCIDWVKANFDTLSEQPLNYIHRP